MRVCSFFFRTFAIVLILMTAPGMPDQLRAGDIRLAWIDNSDNEDGFKIERLVAGLVDAVVTVGANLTSYTDSALSVGSVYCYRVRAFNASGESEPSNQACATAQEPAQASDQTTPLGEVTGTTLSATPTYVSPGGTISGAWSGIANPKSLDWIGLFVPGAADAQFLDWFYVSCSKTADSARASGLCSFAMPSSISTGSFELRLFSNDGYTRLATSNSFSVGTNVILSNVSLAVSPGSTTPGGTVTTMWSGISAPTATDWVGLYHPNAASEQFIDWLYVSCSKTAGAAKSSGACDFPLPGSLAVGNYELRLFANDGYTRLATSNGVVVAAPSGSASSPSLGEVIRPSIHWKDYRVTLKLQSMDDDAVGVVFRFQDMKNHYRFVWNRQSRYRRLERIQGGSVKVLAKDTVRYTTGQTYRLEIHALGRDLKVAVDGRQIFSVKDSAFVSGTIGLYSGSNQGSIFDDVLVEDLATGAVLLSEDFAHGTMAGWTVVDEALAAIPSVWSPEGGALAQSSDIGSTLALYTARFWTDYRVEAKLRSPADGRMGVMFRYQDNDHYYRFSWDGRRPSRRLERVQDGQPTLLAEDAVPYVVGRSYHLTIDANGPNFMIRIDGTLVFSVFDDVFEWGGVALYSALNSGSEFDDLVVQHLPTGAVLLSDNFDHRTMTGWLVVDQTKDQGPSDWSAATGALLQRSAIGSITDFDTLGTFALDIK